MKMLPHSCDTGEQHKTLLQEEDLHIFFQLQIKYATESQFTRGRSGFPNIQNLLLIIYILKTRDINLILVIQSSKEHITNDAVMII